MKCVSCASFKFKNAKLQERLDEKDKEINSLNQSLKIIKDNLSLSSSEIKFANEAIYKLQMKIKNTKKGAETNENTKSN